jgi:hypothetical protein
MKSKKTKQGRAAILLQYSLLSVIAHDIVMIIIVD